MVEDRTRHDRLRSLLPQAYATNPADSSLGVVLEVLADRLREADQAIERGLRDKWLATADGEREAIATDAGETPEAVPALPLLDLGDKPRSLEYLGAALDLLRQPWEAETEAYRGRVEILAPALAGGLGTTRAIIAVSASSLGSEPCPVLEHEDEETRGFGLPPGSLARCRTCQGGQIPAPGTPCPLRDRATMSVSVVDNPRRRVPLIRQQLRPRDSSGARVHFNNLSLFADRPELILSIPESASEAVVPRFRSLTTGEEIIVARALDPGDTLSMRGPNPHDPATPRQRQQWVDRPAAFAGAPARVRVGTDLDVPVFSVGNGATFDSANFDEDQFLSNGLSEAGDLALPSVIPGQNTWVYQPLSRAELESLLEDLDPALDPGDLPDPASLPVTPAEDEEVSLELRWWVRAPSRFLVRIPLTTAVQQALDAGATDYLRRMIDRARPVGVLPIIDFLQPVEPEPLEPLDALNTFDIGIAEDADPLDLLVPEDLDFDEPVEPEDGGGFIGVFDVTVFDFSVFAETDIEPGVFDMTYFDASLLGDLEVEPGEFNATYFDFATYNDLSTEPGEFGTTYFGSALFQ